MCHVLNLMFLDICKLPTIALILADSNSIVKFHKRGQVPGQQLKAVQAEQGVTKDLEMTAATRFVSSFRSMRSVQANKHTLKLVVVGAKYPTTAAAKLVSGIILKDSFWKDLELLVPLLKSLADIIYSLESDTATCADAFWAFQKLRLEFSAAATGADNTYATASFKGDLPAVLTAFETRREYGWHDCFTLSALLHPAHRNKLGAIDSQLRLAAEKLLYEMVGDNNKHVVQQQLVWWRTTPDKLQMWDHTLSGPATRDGVQWWKDNGDGCSVLQTAAMKVLSIPPSAAGGERNFSVWHHIFSDNRASMLIGRVGMLVYIYSNSRMAARDQKFVQNWDDFLTALDEQEGVAGMPKADDEMAAEDMIA